LVNSHLKVQPADGGNIDYLIRQVGSGYRLPHFVEISPLYGVKLGGGGGGGLWVRKKKKM
jgi:hypothetical protein